MTPRQQCGLPRDVEPCCLEDRRKDDGERYRENKGSRYGETEADRALIFFGSRRAPGWRIFVGQADDRFGPAQAGSVPPVRANFMDMSDSQPELQCQSQQRKPRAETAWYRSYPLDHSLRCLRTDPAATPLGSKSLSRRRIGCATENRIVATKQDQPEPEGAVARS
jgi:hypothetical protein